MVGGQGGGFEGMRAHWPWPGVGKASPPRGSGIRLKRWNLSPPSPQARISSGGGVQLNRLERFTELGLPKVKCHPTWNYTLQIVL